MTRLYKQAKVPEIADGINNINSRHRWHVMSIIPVSVEAAPA
jgi:hypothetical protein